MSSIDNRVVKMEFDNARFEQNAKTSIHTIEHLKQAMNFDGAVRGLNELSEQTSAVNLDSIIEAVDILKYRFSTLGIMGMAVLEEIARTALNTGMALMSKVIDPIVTGGKNRAQAIENARFTLQGLISDQGEVNAVLADARDSVDGTAFAFNDAAMAASQFAATGLRAGKEMQIPLKAIAGIAATTNSEYTDISHIFTTVAGNGRLMTEQLNQFSYRGMNAAASMTKAFNQVLDGSSTLSSEMQDHIRELVEFGVDKVKDFSGSLEGITEGDLRALVTAGKIDFQTFSSIMADAFGEHAKDANKTFSGSMANIRAALARTGAMFYEGLIRQEGPLVNFFNAVRQGVNGLNKALPPMAQLWTTTVDTMADRGRRFIEGFVKGEGFDALAPMFENLRAAAEKVADIFARVFNIHVTDAAFLTYGINAAAAFRDFVDAMTLAEDHFANIESFAKAIKPMFDGIGSAISGAADILLMFVDAILNTFDLGDVSGMLASVTSRFSAFVNAIRPSAVQLAKLQNLFEGIFSVARELADVALDLLTSAWDGLGTVLGMVLPKSDDVYDILGKIGDILKSVAEGIHDIFHTADGASIFEDGIGSIADTLSEFIRIFKEITHINDIGERFVGFINHIRAALRGEAELGWLLAVQNALGKVRDFIEFAAPYVIEGIDRIRQSLANLGESIGKYGGVDIVGAFGLGSIGLIITKISEFISSLTNATEDGTGLIDSIKSAFEELTGALENIQNSLKADVLASIAKSVLMFAAAFFVISLIDPDRLMKSLVALTVIVGEIGLLMKFAADLDVKNVKGVVTLGLAMVGLAAALLILTIAAKVLSSMDIESLVKGIAGVTILLGELTIIAKELSKDKGRIMKGAGGLILMAAAVWILTYAVKSLAELDTKSLIKGLIAVTVLLGALSGASALTKFGKMGVGAGLGMLAMAGAIVILSKSVIELANIDYRKLSNGLVAVVIMLAAMTAAANLMPEKGVISSGLGLLAMAAALKIMSGAVEKLGALGIETLIKGIGSLVIMLAVLALTANLMTDALPGAAAMLVISLALIPMAAAIKLMGELPIEKILIGIGGIAAAILIFAGLASVLTPVLPVMAALSGITLVFSIAMATFAAAVLLVATAVSIGGVALIAFLSQLLSLAPQVGLAIGNIFVGFLTSIANMSEAGWEAVRTLITGLLSVITELAPQIAETLMTILLSFVTLLRDYIPQLATIGLEMITALLTAIAEGLPGIITAGADIIIAVLEGLGQELPRIVDAAAQLVIDFINGIADTINTKGPLFDEAVGNLVDAVANRIEGYVEDMRQAAEDLIWGFIDGLGSLGEQVASAAEQVARDAWGAITGFLGIESPSKRLHETGEYFDRGFINGMDHLRSDVYKTGKKIAKTAMDAFNGTLDSDFQPSITPVLDLSNIQNGLDNMRHMIYDRPYMMEIDASMDRKVAERRALYDGFSSRTDFSEIILEMERIKDEIRRQPIPENGDDRPVYNIYLGDNLLSSDTSFNEKAEAFLAEIIRMGDM